LGRWRLRLSFYLALFLVTISLWQNQQEKNPPTEKNLPPSISGIILRKIGGNSEYSTFLLLAGPLREKFLLRCFFPADFSPQDTIIVFPDKVRSLREARNPGEFSWKKFYARQKVYREMVITAPERIVRTGYRRNLRRFFYQVRQKLARRLDRFIPDTNLNSIAGKMLFGSEESLDADWRQYFVNSGVMHILVVSGLHVGYIAAAGYWLFSLTGIRRRYAIFFLTPLLLFYWQLCQASPPVSRATIMTLSFLLAFYLKRESEVFNTFCLAIVFILIFDNAALTGASFQLSFAATLGLILGVSLWPVNEEEISNKFNLGKSIRNKIKSVVVASLAAQIFTLPLIAYYFGRISLVALGANIFIIPLAGVVVWLTALLVGLGDFPLVGIILRYITNSTLALLGILVRFFGQWSFSSLIVRRPPVLAIVIFYLFLLVIIRLSQQNKKYLSLTVGVVAIFLVPLKTNLLPRVQLTFLSLGPGRAAVFQTPDNRTILIDGGALSEKYAHRIISGFLREEGIRRIDTIIITADNYLYFNALPALIDEYKVNEIILPPKIVPESELNLIKENFPATINCGRPPTYLNYAGLELFFFGETETSLEINYRQCRVLILGNTDRKDWPPRENFSSDNRMLFIEITNFGDNKRSQELSELIKYPSPAAIISRTESPAAKYPNAFSPIPKIFNLQKGAVTIKIIRQPIIFQKQ